MGWKAKQGETLPRARDEELLTEAVGDELVVYDLRTKDVHCLGPIAAAVWRQCDGRTTFEDSALLAGCAPEEVAEAVAQLRERALLEAPALVVQEAGVSRRRFVGAGAAVLAVPLISSIVAPTAMAAVSGLPTGCTGCTKPKDCASNHCCQSVPGKNCNQSCCVANNNSCQIDAQGNCTVPLAGCGSIVCPPGSSTCCTTPP